MYTDAYKWNLERWYWLIYLQSSSGETDIEKRPMNTVGGEEGEGEMHGEGNMETYFTICKIDSPWELAICLRELKQALWDNLEGWDGEGEEREVREGGDMDVPMADSCWYTAENHKIL